MVMVNLTWFIWIMGSGVTPNTIPVSHTPGSLTKSTCFAASAEMFQSGLDEPGVSALQAAL